ncbi:MAG: hypothetical protein LBC97_10000 [Bifidobacteriaceae bacterium]|jgi:hypothetical protein|nr:hypothetical protein [Bifidobacteriaceae bacterium]
MSEPTTPATTPGWRDLAVGAVFWRPDHTSEYPQVMADWDGDRLDKEVATVLFNTIADSPGYDEARAFIDRSPKPHQWHEPADVEHWLEALAMDVPGPAFHRDTVLVQADAETAHDVTVAVIRWGEDVWDETQVIGGLDPNLVERELAETIQQRIIGADTNAGYDAFLDVHGQPDLGDPNAVSRWLIAASRELPFPVFTTHHATVDPDSAFAQRSPAPTLASESAGTEASSERPAVQETVATTAWVGAIFRDPDDDFAAEFVVGRSEPEVARKVAARLHEAMVSDSGFERTSTFTERHTRPAEWSGDCDVSDWLLAVETERPGPAFALEEVTVEQADPANPERLFLAAVAQTGSVWNARLLAEANREALERRIAVLLHERLDGPFQTPEQRQFAEEHGNPEKLPGPAAVTAWLRAHRWVLRDQGFDIGQEWLPPLPPASATETMTARTTVDSGPEAAATAPETDGTVTVGVIWWDLDGGVPPEIIVGVDRAAVESSVATRLWEEMHDSPAFDVGDLFDALGDPTGMDAQGVTRWLDGYQQATALPEIRVADIDMGVFTSLTRQAVNQAVLDQVGPPDFEASLGLRRAEPAPSPTVDANALSAGVIVWDDENSLTPTEMEVFIDREHDAVARRIAARLYEKELDDPASDQAARYLEQHGDPAGLHPDGVEKWLDGLREVMPSPQFDCHPILKTATGQPTPAAAPPVPTGQAVQSDPSPAPNQDPAAPAEGKRPLVAAVAWNGGTRAAPQVFLADTRDQLDLLIASRIHAELEDDPHSCEGVQQFLDAYPEPKTPDEAREWLRLLGKNLAVPAVHIVESQTGSPLNPAEPPSPTPTAQPTVGGQAGRDKLMAEHGRDAERVWGPLLDSGIPEMLAEAFPKMPQPEDWPDLDGALHGHLWDAAVEDWMEHCLDLAMNAANVADLLERHEALETFQRKVAVMLAGEPLPKEPDIADYRATRPSYDGEFDDMAYRWDRDQWRADLPKAARRRDAQLARLLRESLAAAPSYPPQPPGGLEKACVDALRQLIVPGQTGQTLGETWLDRDARHQVSRIVRRLGDRAVIVPGPAGHQYSGLSRDAHRCLPPGVYDATDTAGERRYRLVVGTAAQAGGPGWAAAVDPKDRADQATLDDLAKLRAKAVGNKAAGRRPAPTSVQPATRFSLGTPPVGPSRPDWLGQPPNRPARGMSL